MACSNVDIIKAKHPCAHPVAQQKEKARRTEAESKASQHCKEKNVADRWMHVKKSFCLKNRKMLVARPE